MPRVPAASKWGFRSRKLRHGALVLTVTIVASACGGGNNEESGAPGPTGPPQEGGSITVGVEAETNSWLPGVIATGGSAVNIAQTFYDPLVVRTEDGKAEPFLAESLEPNADFTQWTLTLRPGVKFHDGTELTAQVLKANFDDYLTVPTSNLVGNFRGVEMAVVDELTVTYDLDRANVAFPDLLLGPAGWPFSIEAARQYGAEAGANPVGTGPFVFESWVRDDRLVVTRNDDYWWPEEDGPPYLDEIVFRPIPDEQSRLTSMQAGELDAFYTVRGNIIAQAREAADEGSLQIYEFMGNNGDQLILNTLVPPLDDSRVRLALGYGLNQEDLIDALGNAGVAPVRTQFFGPEDPYYSEEAADAYPTFDPERAQDLLDEYIDDEDRSDGKPAGAPISLDVECRAIPEHRAMTQVVQAEWGALGIEVNLSFAEQAQHFQAAIGSPQSNPPFAGDFMVKCWRGGQEVDPYLALARLFGPAEQEPVNFTNFHDDLVAEQLEVLRTESDPDARIAAAEALMLHFDEEMPVIWAGGTPYMIGARPGLQNIDGWTLPDGTLGEGVTGAVTMWAQVWISDE